MPTFLILYKNHQEFGIFDIRDINASFKLTGYIEEESVPKDTEIIQHTWKKGNKDGSADKRFKGNYQIPIVKYGDMTLKTESGWKSHTCSVILMPSQILASTTSTTSTF